VYADDTTLSATLNTFNTATPDPNIENIINSELNNLFIWLKLNKLSLNPDKTKAMIFHLPQRNVCTPNLHIDNSPIEFVNSFNFLGITIDKHLSWKDHIIKISQKISKTTAVMNKLKNFLPNTILQTIYNSLILPHLIYGINLWGSCFKKLEKLQKRAVRIILKTPYNSHSEPIFKKLGILKLSDLCALYDLKFCFKLINNMLPIYFSAIFVHHSDNHSILTRHNNNFQLPLIRHSFAKNNIRYKIASAFNNCPNSIKEKVHTHSITGFTNYIKGYFITTYTDICSIQNCYVCRRNAT
jgi:hypothetical protein